MIYYIIHKCQIPEITLLINNASGLKTGPYISSAVSRFQLSLASSELCAFIIMKCFYNRIRTKNRFSCILR